MALSTKLSALEVTARYFLKEASASYWSSAELIDYFNQGITNLWGMVVDLNQEHHITVDTSNVTLAVDGTQLTGVPADTFRVHIIEISDTTSANRRRDVLFVPRDYNSHEFINARSLLSQDPNNGVEIYYTLTDPGAPVSAPIVLTAPKVSTALTLRFVYVPTLPIKVAADDNPIGGGSDMALVAWVVAYALSKDREDKSPDPNWLATYSTHKESLRTRMTPRQTQEAEVVDDVFGAFL